MSKADILRKIVDQTKEDLIGRKKKKSVSAFRDSKYFHETCRDFVGALKNPDQVAIIAEVKKASPSKGIIRADFNPLQIAENYVEGGASAISVLTEERFFMGSPDYLTEIRERFEIPLLRKDFIVDFYQVDEAKAMGADAILLIATCLEKTQLSELHHAANELGLHCLVECYDEDDFEKLDFKQVSCFGVNNRNLKTFEVNVHAGIDLLNRAPDGVVKVSESGLTNADDIKLLNENGIDAALIGEFFMRQEHPGDALKVLIEQSNDE